MFDARRIQLTHLQSFLVGAVGVWGLLASMATMAAGPRLWTGWLLADRMRPAVMQCGERTVAEEVHRAAASVPSWAPAEPLPTPACIAVPRRALPAGHRIEASDLMWVYLPVDLRPEGLMADGAEGLRLRYPVEAKEPVLVDLVGRRAVPRPHTFGRAVRP